jgi:hypothetical protein
MKEKNMEDVVEEIVVELSNRIPSGIIDLKNESHLNILFGIMNEYIGEQDIIIEWIKNIANN